MRANRQGRCAPLMKSPVIPDRGPLSCGLRSACDAHSAALSPPVLGVLLALALVASALGLVASTHQVRAGLRALQVLELQRWQLQEQYTRLLLEINTWAAPHRISQIASDKLSMLPLI